MFSQMYVCSGRGCLPWAGEYLPRMGGISTLDGLGVPVFNGGRVATLNWGGSTYLGLWGGDNKGRVPTFDGKGVSTLDRGGQRYLPWMCGRGDYLQHGEGSTLDRRLPTLDGEGGTYLGQGSIYLGWEGVDTYLGWEYLPWMGVPTLEGGITYPRQGGEYLP